MIDARDASVRLCRPRPAYTDLEDDMIGVWQPWLPVLGRDPVCLSDELCERLPAGFHDRAAMGFYEKIGAPYRTLRARDSRRRREFRGNEPRTAAFLLRLTTLANRKTGYIGAWGLDGSTTLVWACWLREHPELVGGPGFVMAELVGGSTPARPTDLGCTREWGVEILIHVPIEEGTVRPRALEAADPRGPTGDGRGAARRSTTRSCSRRMGCSDGAQRPARRRAPPRVGRARAPERALSHRGLARRSAPADQRNGGSRAEDPVGAARRALARGRAPRARSRALVAGAARDAALRSADLHGRRGRTREPGTRAGRDPGRARRGEPGAGRDARRPRREAARRLRGLRARDRIRRNPGGAGASAAARRELAGRCHALARRAGIRRIRRLADAASLLGAKS